MLSCRVCGNLTNNKVYKAHEMMLGYFDEFNYFQCSFCGCLQIQEVPENISKYYPSNKYYSYSKLNDKVFPRIKTFLKGKRLRYTINQNDRELLGKFIQIVMGEALEKAWINHTNLLRVDSNVNDNINILDIGCGQGRLLLELRDAGFANLEGIDPFIEEDIFYKSGVRIFKKIINEVDKKYELIMLNHSLEHMPDQKSAFNEIYRILKPNGCALIRIPLCSSYAWEKYGVNWVQLDAPRHFFLHTEQSVKILAENSNLVVKNIIYDSSDFQFWGSEAYESGKTFLDETPKISKLIKSLRLRKRVKENREKAAELNKIGKGDQACFIIVKS